MSSPRPPPVQPLGAFLRGVGGLFDVSRCEKRPLQRLLIAALLVAAAVLLRVAFLGPLGPRIPYVTLFPAVMLAAIYGGLAGGLLATAVSAAIAVLWFQGGRLDEGTGLALIMFLATGALMTLIGELLFRVRESLGKSEERFRIAAKASNDVIYEWDLKDGLEWYGDVDGLLGFGAGEFPRTLKGWTESIHPEDLGRVRAAIEAHLEGRAAYVVEYRMLRKDGAVRWWSARGAVARGPDGTNDRWVGTITDITERKRAEEALRTSQERLLLSQRAAGLGNFSWDIERNVNEWSDEIMELYGLPPGGFGGKHESWRERIFPDDLAAADAAIEQSLVDGDFKMDFRIVRPDGGIRWLHARAKVFFATDGRPLKMIGVNMDITDRKAVEDELRLRNVLLSTHLDVLMDGVLVVSDKSRIIRSNRRFAEILNVPENLLVSGEHEPVLQFIAEGMADPDGFLRKARHLYAHPEEKSHTVLLLKDGRVVERYSAPMFGPDGKNYGRVSNFRDISDAKRAEAALTRSELYYRSLIEHGADIILVLSVDGIIQYASPAVENLLGRVAEELKGQDIFELIHPKDQQLARQRLKTVLGPHTPEYVDLRVRHSDGSWRTLAAIGNVLPPEIGSGIVINARDRTEHLHLESQMRQSQKMEAVGRLAGGIAHDFNNVLTVILGYGQLLAERVKATPEIAEDIAEVLKAAERAATLTRQLLTFSRHRPTEQRVLALDSIVADTEKMLRRLVGEDVVVTAKNGNAGLVKVDPGQIEQVLVNLAVNARDAMPKGGHLTIETSRAELDGTYAATHLGIKPGSYVLLAVTDTGTGMNAATLGHLFEPFFTTKELGKGTGLGLSTVYGIVKQSGGHIEVYSELEHGTTFKIYLPMAAMEKEVRPEISVVRTLERGSETILLVEDEEAVRLLVRRELESRGYTVLIPANTNEALLACDRHTGPIHLLLTDIVMPGMLGPEVARRAYALRPDLKVLYTSGYTDESIMQRGLLQGDEAFIQKPFTPHALSRKVREVLDGGVAPSASTTIQT